MVFLSLRWIFSKFMGGISGLTRLGASLAGQQSGFNRASKAVTEEAAQGILTGPQMAGINFIADKLGFNIESMIEEHGATQTLAGITQLLSMVGIDPQKILTEGIGSMAKGLLGQSSTVKQGKLP